MTMFKTFKSKMIALAMAASMLAVSAFAIPAQAAFVEDDTTEATVTFTGGFLTLDDVPDEIDFGGAPVTVNATNLSYNGNAAVVVSDARGSLAGWNVTAEMSDFTNGTATLDGATITLTGVGNSSTNSNSGEPVSPTNVALSDTATRLTTAAQNAGGGTWNTEWTPTNLYVPAGNARAGTFTSTITWTLNDTP